MEYTTCYDEHMKEVNPLKELRTRHHLTMEQVAEHAGVSRQYIIRAEQGVFSAMPNSVADALLDLVDADVDYKELDVRYLEWQRSRRKESYGSLIIGFDFHSHSEASGPLHPFTHWRHHSGIPARITVPKLFCVHPALIFKFEEQPWLCTSPPSELLVGLRDSGYSNVDISNLSSAYTMFRRARRDHPHK